MLPISLYAHAHPPAHVVPSTRKTPRLQELFCSRPEDNQMTDGIRVSGIFYSQPPAKTDLKKSNIIYLKDGHESKTFYPIFGPSVTRKVPTYTLVAFGSSIPINLATYKALSQLPDGKPINKDLARIQDSGEQMIYGLKGRRYSPYSVCVPSSSENR